MVEEDIMKSKQILRTVVLLVAAITTTSIWSLSSPAPTHATKNLPKIADLAWMAGGWRTAAGGRAQIEEHWMTPSGGSMLGMGRTVVGDRTVEFEFLRLEQRADAIYYVASPGGQCPSTDFKLTRLSAQEVMFENPQHDFPKRIIYKKASDGSLMASVDAGAGTKSQSFSYLPIK
jgi:hypothetical protein